VGGKLPLVRSWHVMLSRIARARSLTRGQADEGKRRRYSPNSTLREDPRGLQASIRTLNMVSSRVLEMAIDVRLQVGVN
jgi:hypothetical protein